MKKDLVSLGLALFLSSSVFSPVIAGPERVKFPKADLSGYTVYTIVNRPDKKWVRYLYANDLAIKGARKSNVLPNGAKIIMATYTAKLDDTGTPIEDTNGNFIKDKFVAYGLMEKQPGWGKEYSENIRNGDWDYSVVLPNLIHKPSVKVEKCLVCHHDKVGSENEYNFTFGALLETARALKIDGMTPKAAVAQEMKVAMADTLKGNVKKGAKLFKRCKACHVVDSSGKHKIGPNLFGIEGRKIASASGYKYSKALRALAAETWNGANAGRVADKTTSLC